MGKQDFAGGGFTGKVGQFVGQRNGSGFILRKHVIPANPKTEQQQANRKFFAICQRLTQFAISYNKGFGGFDLQGEQEFRFRLKLALNRQLPQQQLVDRLPFYLHAQVYKGAILTTAIYTSSLIFTLPISRVKSPDAQTLKAAIVYMSVSEGMPKLVTWLQPLGTSETSWSINLTGKVDYNDIDKNYNAEIFGISDDAQTRQLNSTAIVKNWIFFR